MHRNHHAWPVVAVLLVSSGIAYAQQKPEPANLPDTPAPKQSTGAPQDQKKGKGQNPLQFIARRSFFYPELATSRGPLRSGQKFELFWTESISPPRILSAAGGAGISQARNTMAGYGQGGDGYGKRFGAAMATSASSHFFGTFLLSAMLHDDPRYFVSADGRVSRRVGHALRRVFVTRTDTGGEAFNWPGILGPLAAESLANTYLPAAEQNAGRTFSRFGLRVGLGAANNLLKEYWPTIFRSLRIQKVAPGLEPPPAPVPLAARVGHQAVL